MAVYAKAGSSRWMASVGTGEERERKSFKTEQEANTWESSAMAALILSRVINSPQEIIPTVPSVWTLKMALDQVAKHIWAGTGGEYKALLNANQAIAFFGGDTPCDKITSGWIVEWMEELQDTHENSGGTCNKKLSALNMMLKRAEEFGGLAVVPRTKRYKESQHRIRWFSDTEELQMLATTKHLGLQDLHDFIVLGIDTGFRRSELLGLAIGDYQKGMLMLHAGKTKTGDPRSVPCSDRVKEIINKRRTAGNTLIFDDMSNPQLRKSWDDLRAVLGKNDDAGFIVHVLRHTCATRLVSEGVPLVTVQNWMGHKVIQTTMRYAHMSQGQLQAAVQTLNARKPDLF